MHNKKNFWIFGVLIAACLLIRHIQAVEQNVTQPIGTLVRTWNTKGQPPFSIQPPKPVNYPSGFQPKTPIGELNYICAQWDSEEVLVTAPFDTHYPATEIILTQPQHFVRLLVKPTSSSNGAWIMRSEYVRGKTPAQLQEIFALAGQPIDIVNVEMPASPDPSTGKNYALWTGIAGPINTAIYPWGDGGSVQSRLIADYGTAYFPNYMFTSSSTRIHRQPIGAIALSYQPLAGNGNTGNVATYLDSFIPQAYSDLESVYHELDYLNYIPFGSTPLQDALHQISPEQYSALSFLNFRNALLFSNILLDGNLFRRKKSNNNNSKFNLWVKGIGEFDNKTNQNIYTKFRAQSGGIMACFDMQTHAHFAWGIGAAGIWNNLSWQDVAGKIHGGNAKIGFYTSYCQSSFFIDGAICGGANWNSASRSIIFNGINRQTHSKPSGEDIEINVQGGKTLRNIATPILRFSYLFNRQNHFNENGAQSLNLHVNGFNAHTLRTYLGVEVSRAVKTVESIMIVPHTSLAWINDIALDRRNIHARLVGPENNFSVTGMKKEGNYCAFGLGCNILCKNYCAISAHYDAEAREHFTAQSIKLGIEATF